MAVSLISLFSALMPAIAPTVDAVAAEVAHTGPGKKIPLSGIQVDR